MARRRRGPPQVRLIESAGNDQEAVAQALAAWAILLADHAQRQVVEELKAERDSDVSL